MICQRWWVDAGVSIFRDGGYTYEGIAGHFEVDPLGAVAMSEPHARRQTDLDDAKCVAPGAYGMKVTLHYKLR